MRSASNSKQLLARQRASRLAQLHRAQSRRHLPRISAPASPLVGAPQAHPHAAAEQGQQLEKHPAQSSTLIASQEKTSSLGATPVPQVWAATVGSPVAARTQVSVIAFMSWSFEKRWPA